MNHTLDIYLDILKYVLLEDYPDDFEKILLNDYYMRSQIADLMGFETSQGQAYINVFNRLEKIRKKVNNKHNHLLSVILETINEYIRDNHIVI